MPYTENPSTGEITAVAEPDLTVLQHELPTDQKFPSAASTRAVINLSDGTRKVLFVCDAREYVATGEWRYANPGE
jgi:hypothetical protein